MLASGPRTPASAPRTAFRVAASRGQTEPLDRTNFTRPQSHGANRTHRSRRRVSFYECHCRISCRLQQTPRRNHSILIESAAAAFHIGSCPMSCPVSCLVSGRAGPVRCPARLHRLFSSRVRAAPNTGADRTGGERDSSAARTSGRAALNECIRR